MKLSEFNAALQDLKRKRDELHDELHAILADDNMAQGAAREAEAAKRDQIREAQSTIFPLEMEFAEIQRVVKGQQRHRAEPWVDFEVTLG